MKEIFEQLAQAGLDKFLWEALAFLEKENGSSEETEELPLKAPSSKQKVIPQDAAITTDIPYSVAPYLPYLSADTTTTPHLQFFSAQTTEQQIEELLRENQALRERCTSLESELNRPVWVQPILTGVSLSDWIIVDEWWYLLEGVHAKILKMPGTEYYSVQFNPLHGRRSPPQSFKTLDKAKTFVVNWYDMLTVDTPG